MFGSHQFSIAWALVAVMPFGPWSRTAATLHAAEAPGARFTARWQDGSRTSDAEILDFLDTHRGPTLGGRALYDPRQGARWVRENTLPKSPLPEAYVEYVGGDRMPGRVVGRFMDPEEKEKASPTGPWLLLEPAARLERAATEGTAVRVSLRWLRRVAWQSRGWLPYQPGVLFYRDGRRQPFRSVRFTDTGLRLLLEQGTADAIYDELAELHLPVVDAWQAYVEQLAMLGAKSALLVQMETMDGARMTVPRESLTLRHTGAAGDPAQWIHETPVAWITGPVGVRHRRVRQFTFFAPHRPPLTRFDPAESIHRPILSGGWAWWRRDANVQGGPLIAAGQPFGWGIGVQGQHELIYRLPPGAAGLQTAVGLDATAGEGGCVQARIYRGAEERPVWESPVLAGSREVVDSPTITLVSSSDDSITVRLEVDALSDEAPPGADPLDIRDSVDWLELRVTLSPDWLAAQVAAAAATFQPGPTPPIMKP